ncbi:hypothetical protein NP233_g12711 [Leucocoprinus birnbaumii]|uniref:Uncharacterized protein n=1 Tax=Leucocoprinus birnbaumii TaxID=56174 RepID=A0AAD5VI35_9AGAR|nr:hypothetical protein NP233_g12711 [Leucocoprinus birnbaumii]
MVWGEGEAESDGEEQDSDSSLDLHTPLPHLMVKHGLLSPHSKLLPQAELERRASTPHLNDGRPGSTLSMAKKSGVMKDERNTPMRKERHRDGKLLRGGIGLTTGLGWSDSEDENAPSPLTRRLSSLNLSRRSSAASIKTTGGGSRRVNGTRSASASTRSSANLHPLSRSYSGGAARGIAEDWEGDEEGVDEFGQRVEVARARTISSSSAKPPPTSWHGRPKITTTRPKSRLSPDTTRNSQNSDDTIPTPSSTASASSTLSTSLPQTPQDGDPSVIKGSISRKNARSEWDKDKNLPPLPLQPILKKQSSASKIAFPPSRSRAGSITNSTSTPARPSIPRSTTPSASSAQAAALARVTSPGPVRPLQLPQRYASAGASDRPAVPVPSIPPTLRNSASHNGLQPPSSSLLSSSPHPPSLTPSRSVPGLSMRMASSGTMSTPTSPVMGSSMEEYGTTDDDNDTGFGGDSAGAGKMRAPMPLVSSSTSLGSAAAALTPSGVKGVSSGLAMRKGLAPISVGVGSAGGRQQSSGAMAGVPRTPTTPIGQAF